MEWKPDRMDRLYELYQQHISRLRAAVIETNRSLGSPHPEQTKLECLPRAEVERLLTGASDDPEVTRLWLRRVLRGHEHEFPDLESVRDRVGTKGARDAF